MRYLTVVLLVAAMLAPAPALAQTETCFGRAVTVSGTDNDDDLQGTPQQDVIDTGEGNDQIDGLGGKDFICGGPGDDTIYGNEDGGSSPEYGFPDVINGGSGSDVIHQGEQLLGGVGSDEIYADGNSEVAGGPGNDLLSGQPSGADEFGTMATYRDSKAGVVINLRKGIARGEGRDRLVSIINLVGSKHDDVIKADNEHNYIHGLAGDDRILGGGGQEFVWPGPGADYVDAEAGNNSGIEFDDARRGVMVDLRRGIARGEGRDRILNFDWVDGGPHDDVIHGDAEGNSLGGEAGDDVIRGHGGNDHLDGYYGSDRLTGGAGNDYAEGGPGRDFCSAEDVYDCERR